MAGAFEDTADLEDEHLVALAARATAVRHAAIRAYMRGERNAAFAVRFAEELLPGWDA